MAIKKYDMATKGRMDNQVERLLNGGKNRFQILAELIELGFKHPDGIGDIRMIAISQSMNRLRKTKAFDLVEVPVPSAAPKAASPSTHSDRMTQVITGIQAWGLTYNRGSAVQCIASAGEEVTAEGEIEAIKKAAWFLQRELERLMLGGFAASRSEDPCQSF